MENEFFNKLVKSLKELPGVGKKQFEKIAFYLIHNQNFWPDFKENLERGHENFNKCLRCNKLDILNQMKLCHIYNDVSQKNKIEDINSPIDLEYFSNITKLLNPDIKLILGLLLNYIGEINSQISNRFFKQEGFKITQLAQGIPLGAQVEYMNELTLKLAFEKRKKK